MTVSTLNGLTSLRDCGKDVYCHRFFSMFFSPLQRLSTSYKIIDAVLVRFSEDPDILRDLVHLEEVLGEDGVKVKPLACLRRSVWGMLHAEDAGIVSRSAEGLAKTMTVIVTVFEAAGLTVSEKKTETINQCCCGHPTRQSRPHRSSSKQRASGICRRCRFCTWAALSTQAPTLCQTLRGETTDPTRMSMLQSVQAGAVRYGGCPVHSNGAHA